MEYNYIRDAFLMTDEEAAKKLEDLKRWAFAEKRCCTCMNYIPEFDGQRGFETMLPECKRGGVAEKTCEHYVRKDDALDVQTG